MVFFGLYRVNLKNHSKFKIISTPLESYQKPVYVTDHYN